MGKGDKKSKRGKIFNGTFGVRRPHGHSTSPSSLSGNSTKAIVAETTPVKRAAGGAKKKS